jgi:hypothetical protein
MVHVNFKGFKMKRYVKIKPAIYALLCLIAVSDLQAITVSMTCLPEPVQPSPAFTALHPDVQEIVLPWTIEVINPQTQKDAITTSFGGIVENINSDEAGLSFISGKNGPSSSLPWQMKKTATLATPKIKKGKTYTTRWEVRGSMIYSFLVDWFPDYRPSPGSVTYKAGTTHAVNTNGYYECTGWD